MFGTRTQGGNGGADGGGDGRARPGRPLLLLVEDDQAVGSLIVEMLAELPCEVVTATSGELALHLIEDNPVRIAVVDQTLPGMPGAEFVARARVARPGLRAVLISGAPIEQTVGAAADPVLLKPFRLSQLHALVAPLLA